MNLIFILPLLFTGWSSPGLIQRTTDSKAVLIKDFANNLNNTGNLKNLFPSYETVARVMTCEKGNLLWSIIQQQQQILDENRDVFQNITTEFVKQETNNTDEIRAGFFKDGCLFLQQVSIFDIDVEVKFTTDKEQRNDTDEIQVLQVFDNFYLLSL